MLEKSQAISKENSKNQEGQSDYMDSCNGNRIKLMRQANCLTLQQLADHICSGPVSITKAAISHYETGKTSPNTNIIQILAKELGTVPSFFFKKDWEDFEIKMLEEPDVLPSRRQELLAFLQVELERNLEVDYALGVTPHFRTPKLRTFTQEKVAEIEAYISELRELWKIGDGPVASVCAILEHQGWCLIPSTGQFEDLEIAGYELSKKIPFLLYHPNYFVDDFRYSLLRQIGRFYIEGETAEETEELAQRLARGILISREQTIYEFGQKRTKISERELSIAKQKYGISKRMLMARLHELGIIDDQCYEEFDTYLRQHIYLKREKTIGDMLHFYEVPTSVDMKVLRAKTEGLHVAEINGYYITD